MFVILKTHLNSTFFFLFFVVAISGYSQDTLTVLVPDSSKVPLLHKIPKIQNSKRGLKFSKITAKKYTAKMDSLIIHNRRALFPTSDLLNNPYYFSLMGGVTLYSSSLHNKIGYSYLHRRNTSDFCGLESSREIYNIIDESDTRLIQAYSEVPWFVRYLEETEGLLNVDKDIRESVKPEATLTEHFTDGLNPGNLEMLTDTDFGIVVRKPNFWTFKTNFTFQFTQNYVTDNWYKGGESHNALLAAALIEANFDNRQKLTFDNRLEMKLGFQTSDDDLKHKFKTNSDLLRLTNKLGFCAVKDWYYTIMLQSWTQFYKGYKPNDPKIYSDFMAPFVSLLSLGMDYKKQTANNRFNITATISPIALKMQYVKRPELVTSFGHDEGQKVKWEYGSNITVSYVWNIWKNISWAGRFYFFSDYSKSQIEWENTFTFTINKYLSTRLFLYPRFDDAVVRKDGQSYFQFNELLSLGLNFDF